MNPTKLNPTKLTFFEYLRNQRRLSEKTVSAYESDLKLFNGEPDRKSIREWIREMHHYNPNSIKRKFAAMNAYCRFLRSRGIIKDDPCKGITLPKPIKPVRNALSKSDMEYLLSVPDNPDKLIVQTLYMTGMRISELINLRSRDVEPDRIKVTGKGNKQRIIPRMAGLELDLKHEFVFGGGKKLKYYQARESVEKYLKLVSGQTNPHILRHTFATHLLNNGANMVAIRDLLGHSTIASTQVYAKNNFESMKKSHKLLNR